MSPDPCLEAALRAALHDSADVDWVPDIGMDGDASATLALLRGRSGDRARVGSGTRRLPALPPHPAGSSERPGAPPAATRSDVQVRLAANARRELRAAADRASRDRRQEPADVGRSGRRADVDRRPRSGSRSGSVRRMNVRRLEQVRRDADVDAVLVALRMR